MPRLWREFNHDLAWQACDKALQHKWRRNDTRTFLEEWTGHSREEMDMNELEHGNDFGMKYEILEECACMTEDMVEGILHGVDPDFDPVETERRPDGNTGKIRNIATLCMRHQILGHVVCKGLEPLMQARIMPTQHASIPGRGQTGLARQIRRYLRRQGLDITKYVKTDCTGAYASLTYETIIRMIRREIPRAKWIIQCMEVLERYAPGGHLIIGGYIDAWLFNFVMSYAIRYIYSLHNARRGKKIPLVIRAVTFMDDMALLGRNRKALLKAADMAKEWMEREQGLKMRITTSVITLKSMAQEKARKKMTGAKRGCPNIDMGGYRICRSYITIRGRNIPKMIRCAERAWEEYQESGTIRRQRGCQIISRNGMTRNSDSHRLREKHHMIETMRLARRNQAYWSRQNAERRKEKIRNAAEKYRKQCEAFGSYCGSIRE